MNRTTSAVAWLALVACSTQEPAPPDGIVIEEWSNLVARMDEAEDRIDALTVSNNTLSARLEGAEQRLAEEIPDLQGQVAANDARIATLDSRMAVVEQQLGQTRLELDDTTTSLTGALSNLTLVSGRLTTVEVDVGSQALTVVSLDARLSDAEAQLLELPASTVITVDNMNDIAPDPGEQIQLTTALVLTGNYDLLDVDEVQINGGGFVGAPGIEVELGSGITFTNTHFEDVLLDGRDTTFVNCTFEGTIAFPSDAHIVGGEITRVTQETVRMLDSITGTEIDDSNLVRVDRIANADISGSTLGGPLVNANHIGRLTGSEIHESLVYTDRGSTIVGNEFDDSTVAVTSAQFGSVTLAANIFSGPHLTYTASIDVDGESANFAQITISGNSFMGNDSVPSHIRVSGVASGNYQAVHITGNTLMRSLEAIDYTGTLPIVVSGNVFRGTPMGVATGTTLTVFDNTSL